MESNKVGELGRNRTEHEQNTTQDGVWDIYPFKQNQTGVSERFRKLNSQCYLLERGLLCGPCYQ